MERVFVSNEFEEARICFDLILDEILLDLCFEYHWRAKTGLSDRPHQQTDQSPVSFVTAAVIICPHCQTQVSGYRYAQHLEKCLNGTKRSAATRKKQNNSPPVIEPPLIPPSRKKPRYYGSLTVRIKLKNGVPISNMRRRTVPSLVFLSHSLNNSSTSSPRPASPEEENENGIEEEVEEEEELDDDPV